MITVQALANTVLKRAFEESIDITPMKLQKLLYFIYRDYLQNTNKPLFAESFLVWKHGPILSSVYYEFNSFHSSRIDRFARDAKGKVFWANDSDEALSKSLDDVWAKYKNKSGIELSQITLEFGSAWYKAFWERKTTLNNEDIKNDRTGVTTIRQFKGIERD